MSEEKFLLSYAQVHTLVKKTATHILEDFKPDVILAIGGGGFIPARLARTFLSIPILAVGLELYDDTTNLPKDRPIKTQWFDETSGVGKRVRGKRVLVVDEVDDTRTTLQFCVEELAHHEPADVGVLVLINKRKEKRGVLDEKIRYYAAQEIADRWCVFPWDAQDIETHERLAVERGGK
mmetsp:Transcript_36710/g.92030  ORF Transcript_36710/g.92030 Transcript_36710/m.92030 type:complete len:179 (+) Transcript_36710:156-692(+)|eukprot:CAMPEP_0177635558 /NCGR_PEP_ID=MMETSP0447-20121125/3968_1 /TAXON_ID=0 /ORGANISM="Stygamoeba regulata, Strain BSH-02190019" /LENGTH=178 /DNA_ID=CAMNT_0019137359 /DNA_START=103 /DNA_END=639 /DNA_ORIENTATION=-